jgi:hypothetical protein
MTLKHHEPRDQRARPDEVLACLRRQHDLGEKIAAVCAARAWQRRQSFRCEQDNDEGKSEEKGKVEER